MPKAISWRKFVQGLRQFGFEGPLWGGKHPFMVKGELKLHIPREHGKDIRPGLLCEILRQAGITVKEWESRK